MRFRAFATAEARRTAEKTPEWEPLRCNSPTRSQAAKVLTAHGRAKRMECVQLAGAVVWGWPAGKREQAPRTPYASRDSVAARLLRELTVFRRTGSKALRPPIEWARLCQLDAGSTPGGWSGPGQS